MAPGQYKAERIRSTHPRHQPYTKAAELKDDSTNYTVTHSAVEPIPAGTKSTTKVQQYERVPVGLQPHNKRFNNVKETRTTTTQTVETFYYRNPNYVGVNPALAAQQAQDGMNPFLRDVHDYDTDPNATQDSEDDMAVQMAPNNVAIMLRRDYLSKGLDKTHKARTFLRVKDKQDRPSSASPSVSPSASRNAPRARATVSRAGPSKPRTNKTAMKKRAALAKAKKNESAKETGDGSTRERAISISSSDSMYDSD